MPEPFYYPNPGTNAGTAAPAGFGLPYQTNYNQPPAWSTATNTQPPPAGFGYNEPVNIATAPQNAGTAENQQYVTADHLFSSASAYQNSFSAPYLNGGMGNWSYFNNPNSFFFPTGTGDLNLSWGAPTPGGTENAATAGNATAFLQDIYKQPQAPTMEQQEKVEPVVNPSGGPVEMNGMNGGYENGDGNVGGVHQMHTVDSVEHALSNLTVMNNEVNVNDGSHGNQQVHMEPHMVAQQQQPIQDPAIMNSIPQQPTIPVPAPVPVQSAPQQSNAPAKPVSWAAVASQPAKSKPNAPKKSTGPKPNEGHSGASSATGKVYSAQGTPSNTGTYNQNRSNSGAKQQSGQQQQQGRWQPRQGNGNEVARDNDSHLDINHLKDNSPLLRKLMQKYNFNPREFNLTLTACRFFIIKSYSEDDIFRSIKYSSWTSTEHGNRRLNECYREMQRTTRGPMYLLYSVNSSGHFCGVAQMMSEVDLTVETGIWVQDKWKGRFDVRWIYVKDVPNNSLRHIRLENNENKPVTNSRDTQEVPQDKGKQILKIIHNYKAQTSIFDDFSHYEKRQEEDAKMRSKKMPEPDL